jgi:hypothetical protein
VFSCLLHQSFIVCLASVSLLNFSALALAPTPQGSLSLAWDPSSDPNVVGYRLYQGDITQVYTNVIDVGHQTSIRIPNLVAGTTYFFAVTAYDSTGSESAFSGEIEYTVPPSTLLSCALGRNSSGQITVSGTAPAGWINDVWVSQDLLSWLLIGSVIADATGTFHFADPANTVLPFRFYRLTSVKFKPAVLDTGAAP